MAGGLEALQALLDDAKLGPRGEPEVEAPAKSEKTGKTSGKKAAKAEEPVDEEEAEDAEAPPKKAFFGFGPVR
jgi:hypothetical protein